MTVALFILVVGLISTALFDLWKFLIDRARGKSGPQWGPFGRWLLGLRHGHLVLNGENPAPPSLAERLLGWAGHYAIGLAYAGLLPLIWGAAYIATPTLVPALWIGFGLSTFAGLVILMPAMGSGLFASKRPNPSATIAEVLVNHMVYAMAIYGASKGFAAI